MLTYRAPAAACSTFEYSMISGGDQHRLEAGEEGSIASSRDGARRAIAHRPGDGGDVRGSRPATAAHDIDEPAFEPVANLTRGLFRGFVVLAELVRKAGVGISHHQRVGDARQGAQMRSKLRRAERAVESDGE